MAASKLIGGNKRKLPEVNQQLKEEIIDSASFDTRTEQQKDTKKKEAALKNTKKAKSLSLSYESLQILNDLTEITGRSERDILADLAQQALNIMKPKIETAKEFGMVPSLNIGKKAGQQ